MSESSFFLPNSEPQPETRPALRSTTPKIRGGRHGPRALGVATGLDLVPLKKEPPLLLGLGRRWRMTPGAKLTPLPLLWNPK
jgi:hypothetical protein